MNSKKWAALVAVCAMCGMWSVVADDPPAASEATRTAGVVTPKQNDARILQWVKIDCDAITHCAELGAEKATNPDVKAFAQKVVDDHKRWHNSMKEKFSDLRISAYDPKADDNKTAVVVKDDGASRDGRVAYAPTDFIAAKESVCKHMRKVGSAAMKELSGDEFDNAVLKHLAMGHEAAIASIDAVSGNASTELANALKEAKDGLQKHLDAAKEMCKARKGK